MKITVIGFWGDIYTNVKSVEDNGVNLYINSNEDVSILHYGVDRELGNRAMEYARDMTISANYYNKDNVLINFYNFGEEASDD